MLVQTMRAVKPQLKVWPVEILIEKRRIMFQSNEDFAQSRSLVPFVSFLNTALMSRIIMKALFLSDV